MGEPAKEDDLIVQAPGVWHVVAVLLKLRLPWGHSSSCLARVWVWRSGWYLAPVVLSKQLSPHPQKGGAYVTTHSVSLQVHIGSVCRDLRQEVGPDARSKPLKSSKDQGGPAAWRQGVVRAKVACAPAP